MVCGFAAIMGLAASVALAQPVFAQDEAGWQANDDDTLLLDVQNRAFRLGDGVRGYQTPSGVCVDFADVIQALDLPVRLDKKSRRATGWIFAESETFTLDLEANTVQTMNNRRDLADNAVRQTPEGWCVSVTALSDWLGIGLRPDLSNAALHIETERKLPFLLAIERQQRAARVGARNNRQFDLATLPRADDPYRAFRPPSVDAQVTFNFRDLPNQQAQTSARYALYATGELGAASVEARLASDESFKPDSLRVRAYRVDPAGELLGPLKATQIAFGDVVGGTGALAAQSSAGRGAFITNRQYASPDRFGTTSLRGELPVGWDAELYRDGQLIAFAPSREDGRYAFLDVPLLLGPNRFEVVLYGPQGQIRRETTDMPVGQESIPAGKTQYWASITDQGRDLIHFGARSSTGPPGVDRGWRWGAGIEHGIDKRTSAGLAHHSLIFANRRRNYLEATLRRSVGAALFELTAAEMLATGPRGPPVPSVAPSGRRGGTALRGQMLALLGGLNIQAETLWVRGGYESDLVRPNLRQEHALRAFYGVKLGEGATLPIEASLRHGRERDGTKVTEILTRLGIVSRRLALNAELRLRDRDVPDAVASGGIAPSRREAEVALLGNTRFGKLRLRGEAVFGVEPVSRFRMVNLTAEMPLSERSDLRAVLQHEARGRTSLALGYVRQFDRFSLNGSVEAASDGAVAAGLALAFSFGPDPVNGGLRFSNEKRAATGAAMVSVFRDDNADGLRQPGEPALPEVEVVAGYSAEAEPTNAEGKTLLLGLRPFQPVMVAIDAQTLPDAFLQPAQQGIVITPRPGIASRVELAVTASGEVEGSLLSSGGEPQEGVDLELVDAAGAVRAKARSDFDGFFLFEKVPYGRYSLRIERLAAQILRVAETTDASTMVVGLDKPIARLGPVRLAPLATQDIAQTAP